MVETPLIRHGFAVPPSPLWGEGSRSTQIGWNCSHCGTFGYIYWELGRSAPVGGGRPSVPPLRRRRGKPGRRAESSRPTEWSAGNGRVRTPAPTGIVGEKRRAHNVRPYKRERGKLPPHPSGLRPATFPPGGRLRKNKKGQVLDLSLKTQRRNAVSQKVLLPTFLSRKVGAGLSNTVSSDIILALLI